MPDGDIDILPSKIDVVHARGDAEVDLGTGLGEPAEAVHQHASEQRPKQARDKPDSAQEPTDIRKTQPGVLRKVAAFRSQTPHLPCR